MKFFCHFISFPFPRLQNVMKRKVLKINAFSAFFSFAEAMRLISDIKNDHFEPINFIQVSWLRPVEGWRPFIHSTASICSLIIEHSIELIKTLEWTESLFDHCTNCLHITHATTQPVSASRRYQRAFYFMGRWHFTTECWLHNQHHKRATEWQQHCFQPHS